MRRIILVASILLLSPISSAQQHAATPSFRFERPIVPNGAGARRLAVDVPLLAGGGPFALRAAGTDRQTGEQSFVAADGLADLRLFDASGREVAYLLIPPPRDEPVWMRAATLPIPDVETERTKTSGFEADLQRTQRVDQLRIDGIAAPFLKRVRLEASGDRQRWTLLVAEGTIFDLPAEHLRHLELDFRPGEYRYVRITWDDTRSARVNRPPFVSLRASTTVAPQQALTTPLAFERRQSEPGRSRFRVRLAGAHLPIAALELDAGGEHLLRHVVASESRLTGDEAAPHTLGEGIVRRVMQGSLEAASMRVAITPPSTAELELDVNDGDNPPLELRGVRAVFAALPWIYFESDGAGLLARYGNSTLPAPKYDLEAVRDKVHIDAIADAAWGDVPTRTPHDTFAAPPPLPTVGSSLDVARFAYVREIPRGAPGLIALRLDAAALAHSAGRGARAAPHFADVRIVDGDGRQVPYLVERASEPLSIDLPFERVAAVPRTFALPQRGVSVYQVRCPFEQLPTPRLTLMTSARVFSRRVVVGRERTPDRTHRDRWLQPLGSTTWTHADQERTTPALTMSLPAVSLADLFLVVFEGDNVPLPIESARLLLPAYRLRLFRTEGASLRLVYGRPDLEAPQYDLALLAPEVLGAPATEVLPADERPMAAVAPREIISPRVFWAVLGGAVIVLLLLIARLINRTEPTGRPA